jgi:hypothetical protein
MRNLVIIQITWNAGRSVEVKKRFYRMVADGIAASRMCSSTLSKLPRRTGRSVTVRCSTHLNRKQWRLLTKAPFDLSRWNGKLVPAQVLPPLLERAERRTGINHVKLKRERLG